jgi:hypothetical protein
MNDVMHVKQHRDIVLMGGGKMLLMAGIVVYASGLTIYAKRLYSDTKDDGNGFSSD